MSEDAPKLLAINHDDYHAQHIGRTADGRQFLMTNPFVPARGDNPGCEFIAVYFFDAQGAFLEARIDNLGFRAQVEGEVARALFETRLAELGEVEFGDIEVAPFHVNRFDVEFGLIPRPPEADDDHWWVELLPGNYMAFYQPWDGDYDT